MTDFDRSAAFAWALRRGRRVTSSEIGKSQNGRLENKRYEPSYSLPVSGVLIGELFEHDFFLGA